MSLVALTLVLLAVAATADAGDFATHQRIDVRLSPDQGRVEVESTIQVGEDGLGAFRLDDGLVRPRATIDGEVVELIERGGAWQLREPPPAGTTLTLEYAFEVPTEPDPAGPFLGSAGGFLPSWTGWLPAPDQDLVAFDLQIEVPLPHVAVASGDLVEESRDGGVYRARFVADAAGGMPNVFSGRYAIDERTAAGVRYRTYFTEATRELSDLYLTRAADYIARFEEEIGAYPYQGFAVVAAPIPVGLGFPGLTYVSERILPLPFMQTRSLAHEILHSWFGNAVRVDYATGNWAEGLTTYLADYGVEDDPAGRRAMRLGWLRDYNALPAERDVALREVVAKKHDADQIVGYDKAAFVFHMLRRRLGDADFEAGLHRFYEAHRFATAGWRDLQTSFEAVSGQDLERFFVQWLDRPGAPSLTVEGVQHAQTDTGHEIRLILAQAGPPYELRVPVRIETASGRERVLIPVDGERTATSIRTDARPVAVEIDPAFDVFRRLMPGEAPPILRDVLLDPGVQAVVLSNDERTTAVAGALLDALFEGPATPAETLAGTAHDASLLLIGLDEQVDDALQDLGLDTRQRPPDVDRGTAAVWVAPRDDAPPVLVVRARDASALEALVRPLPHYRRDSWLLFDGSRATESGVWAPGRSALSVRFQ